MQRGPAAGRLLLAVALASASGAAAQEMAPVCLASGRPEGNYYRLAGELREAIDGRGLGFDLQVLTTEGSYANAGLLRERRCDLALIQSDVAYLEHFRGHPFQAIAQLGIEPVHVLVRRELGWARLSEVRFEPRLRVAVGEDGSGTQAHAYSVLAALDPAFASVVDVVPVGLSSALEGIRRREIDLAFQTASDPIEAIAAAAGEVRLLEIDRDLIVRLLRRNPFFAATEIPYRIYGPTGHDAPTVGVRTLLVAHPEVPAPVIEATLVALDALAGKESPSALLGHLPRRQELDDLSIPAHPSALAYRQRHTSRLDRWFAATRQLAVPLIAVGLLTLTFFQATRLSLLFHRYLLGRILVLLAAIWLTGTGLMHWIEGERNSHFRTFGDSAIAILHYLFSGLEAKVPVTTTGHFVAILILSGGVAVVTLLTATLVSLLVERALNLQHLPPKPKVFLRLRDHIVVTGWSDRTKRLLCQLRSDDLPERPPVVVIVPDARRTTVENRRGLPHVWVVEGSPTDSRVLELAGLAQARAAIILASENGGRDDLEAAAVALAIERTACAVYTVVEGRTAAAVEHLANARVDEYVDVPVLTGRLLSQGVISPGITLLYDELFSFGRRSQEIRFLPLPRWLDGADFPEIARALSDSTALPLGWRRPDGVVHLNPRGALRSQRLRSEAGAVAGDALVVLCDEARNLPRRRPPVASAKAVGRPVGTPVTCAALPPEEVAVGICGWGEKALQVVRQLSDPVLARHQRYRFTVWDESAGSGENPEADPGGGVRFVTGDPTRRHVLVAEEVQRLDTLLVIAENGCDDAALRRRADYKTLMIALAASEVAPGLHIVAEVLEGVHREQFRRIPNLEIVSDDEVTEKALAQAVMSPGITEVFAQLLAASDETSEIYLVPVPPAWQGCSFRGLRCLDLPDDEPVIFLGYRRAGQGVCRPMALNPGLHRKRRAESPGNADHLLAAGDDLIVMAYERPSWPSRRGPEDLQTGADSPRELAELGGP